MWKKVLSSYHLLQHWLNPDLSPTGEEISLFYGRWCLVAMVADGQDEQEWTLAQLAYVGRESGPKGSRAVFARTESQKDRMSEVGRDPWRLCRPTSLLKQVTAWAGYSYSCPDGFWISPGKETPQPLWAACSNVQSSAQYLMFRWNTKYRGEGQKKVVNQRKTLLCWQPWKRDKVKGIWGIRFLNCVQELPLWVSARFREV